MVSAPSSPNRSEEKENKVYRKLMPISSSQRSSLVPSKSILKFNNLNSQISNYEKENHTVAIMQLPLKYDSVVKQKQIKRRVSFAPEVTLHKIDLIPHHKHERTPKRRETIAIIPSSSRTSSDDEIEKSGRSQMSIDSSDEDVNEEHQNRDVANFGVQLNNELNPEVDGISDSDNEELDSDISMDITKHFQKTLSNPHTITSVEEFFSRGMKIFTHNNEVLDLSSEAEEDKEDEEEMELTTNIGMARSQYSQQTQMLQSNFGSSSQPDLQDAHQSENSTQSQILHYDQENSKSRSQGHVGTVPPNPTEGDVGNAGHDSVMECTQEIGKIQLVEEDLTVDISKLQDSIYMESTQNIGGIRDIEVASNTSLEDEELPMELTEPIEISNREVQDIKTHNSLQLDNAVTRSGDRHPDISTMDVTQSISSIHSINKKEDFEEISDSTNQKHHQEPIVTEKLIYAPHEVYDPHETVDISMELTQAIGKIHKNKANSPIKSTGDFLVYQQTGEGGNIEKPFAKRNIESNKEFIKSIDIIPNTQNYEIPMDLTQSLGGISNKHITENSMETAQSIGGIANTQNYEISMELTESISAVPNTQNNEIPMELTQSIGNISKMQNSDTSRQIIQSVAPIEETQNCDVSVEFKQQKGTIQQVTELAKDPQSQSVNLNEISRQADNIDTEVKKRNRIVDTDIIVSPFKKTITKSPKQFTSVPEKTELPIENIFRKRSLYEVPVFLSKKKPSKRKSLPDPTSEFEGSSFISQNYIPNDKIGYRDSGSSLKQHNANVLDLDYSMETSYNQEVETTKIPLNQIDVSQESIDDYTPVSLKEFMDAISIKFYDDLQIRDKPKRRSLTIKNQEFTLNDYIMSYSMLSNLELYDFSCRELRKNISDGKILFEKLEIETQEENPPLMREYFEAVPAVRLNMNSEFQIIKDYARYQARAVWYGWRTQLVEGLLVEGKKNYDMLHEDEIIMDRRLEKLDVLHSSVSAAHSRLKQKLQSLTNTKKQTESFDKSTLKRLREELVRVKTGFTTNEGELTRKTETLKKLSEDIQTSKEKANFLTKIVLQNEKTLKLNRNFETAELESLNLKFEILQSSSNLKFQDLKGKVLSLVLDESVAVTMDLTDVNNLSNITYKLPENFENKAFEFFANKIHTLINCNNIVEHLIAYSKLWYNLKAFNKEFFRLSLRFPIKIVETKDESLTMSLRYFSLKTKIKLFINIQLDIAILKNYPNFKLEQEVVVVTKTKYDELPYDGDSLINVLKENCQNSILLENINSIKITTKE